MRALALLLALLAWPAWALAPEERLADPALEARARVLSQELRCVVCQNQSIDDSDAGVARDLRRIVRERLVAGADDATIRAELVARYGDYVLLRPRWNAATWILWLAPLLMLAGALVWWRVRRVSPPSDPDTLSAAEEARLRELL